MKVPNIVSGILLQVVSLSRLQNEGSQPSPGVGVSADKSIKATE